MRELQVYIVDSFTDEAFKGNPAGVVLYQDFLSKEEMLEIAKEISLPETVFFYNDRVHYFTPTVEVDFCGHATLALSWILGMNHQMNELEIKTNVGWVKIELVKKNQELKQVKMCQVSPKVRDYKGDIDEVLNILDLKTNNYNHHYPIKYVYSGNWDLLIPIESKALIDKVNPSMNLLNDFQNEHQITSIHLFTFYNNKLYTRNFAPAVGIDEDPVTGSTNGALVGYLMLEKILPWKNQKIKIIQTNKMNRLGQLLIEVNVVDGLNIKVCGKALPIISGKMKLDKR